MATTIEDIYGKNGSLRVKDLFERLPYGVFVLLPDSEEEVVVFTADYHPNWFKAKAYLRPMNDMTEEEEREWCKYSDEPTICGEHGKSIDWLNENYFDWRGLIEIGEAIEAPKGMYVRKGENVEKTKEEVLEEYI